MINLNGNSSSSRQVTFITHPSIQSKAFASYLSETLMAPVVLQNINKPLAQRLAKDSVILFDIAVSNKKLNGVWRDIIRLQADNPRLLIINSAQKYELYEMAQWPALYGVFRHDDDESRLIEGVKAVLNGEQTAELSVRDAPGDVRCGPCIDSSRELAADRAGMRDPQRTALRRDEPGYRPRAVYQREHGADAPVQCVS